MSTQTDVMGQVDRQGRISPVGFGLKTLGMWVTVVIGSMLAGKLVPVELPVPPQDGPLSILQAFLVVNGLIAVALSFVAVQARVTGWRLAILLFVAYFAIGSAMMQIETYFFNAAIQMPVTAIFQLVEQAAVIGVIVGAVGALLFHPVQEVVGPLPSNLLARVALMTAIYVALYWGAGFFIAWQSEAVRTYYSNGVHIPPVLPTIGFQIFRGTLWALISLFIVTRMKGSLASRAMIMAVLFAVLTAAQLLYPNPLVPWAVRQMHLIEVGSSEFVYGLIATFVLLAGGAKNPLSESSPWRLIAGRA
jgi:hypothetical protein